MNKMVISLLALTSIAFGFQAEVKKSDVKISVNEKLKSLKVGDTFTLNSGDMVCFESGDGRVVISGEDYKKSLNKHIKSCKVLPGKDSTTVQLSLGGVLSPLQKSHEDAMHGMSRKSAEVSKFKKIITAKEQQKYILFQSNQWGLPVTLKVYDNNHKVVIEDKNEENIYTSFAIPTRLLKDGYKIEIKDGFNEAIVDSVIKFKKETK